MKKQNILLVLKILETESDKKHPMTQTQIADIISGKYPCDRKTVGRNIRFLIDIGYPIIKTTRGFYMGNREFTIEERALILAAINCYSEASEQQKENITDRLTFVLNKLSR